MHHHTQGLTVELAEVGPPNTVRCIEVNEPEELYTLMRRFFGQHTPLQAMTDVVWRASCHDHDKFIPHPPGASNPANIVELFRHAEPWRPTDVANERSWHLLKWLKKLLQGE
jgi:hypothetical protein